MHPFLLLTSPEMLLSLPVHQHKKKQPLNQHGSNYLLKLLSWDWNSFQQAVWGCSSRAGNSWSWELAESSVCSVPWSRPTVTVCSSRSSKRENCKLRDSSGQHLTVEFCSYPANVSQYIDYRYCSLEEESHNAGSGNKVPVCEKFSVSNVNPRSLPGSMERGTFGLIQKWWESTWELPLACFTVQGTFSSFRQLHDRQQSALLGGGESYRLH